MHGIRECVRDEINANGGEMVNDGPYTCLYACEVELAMVSETRTAVTVARMAMGRAEQMPSLLVRALYARLAIRPVVVFVHRISVTVSGAPLLLSVGVDQLDLLEQRRLAELLERLPRWQGLLEQGNGIGGDKVGELDGELDDEVTGLMMSL